METKPKILVIEDDIPVQKVLADKLGAEELDVIVASDGEKGLKMALADHPNLILLDIIMPNMDGMTMLQKLRQDEWGKDAKVVILTNLADAYKAEEANKRGVFDYLVKSDWKLEDLVKMVKDKLNKK